MVIGASGEVGEGVVAALLTAGREVVAAARDKAGLESLAGRLGHPSRLRLLAGSVADDGAAQRLAVEAGAVSHVVVAVNGQRKPLRLKALDTPAMAALLAADLLSHHAAVRCFLPRLPRHGCLVGIGGGSADFILDGGVPMSMAQAALRQMYRGFAHEREGDVPALRELIVASVVAGRRHGEDADPDWVTAGEIGGLVADMLKDPARYPGTIWRIARRGADGRPVVAPEAAAAARTLPL
ncbi:SDR family oxidoreductase [Sandaracinobacter sp. RS1-74]|uniref:SDR family oxidoreductase n=1 Tax=Sandaracinobacteroides sayramensis TaxID=2913411 RepID=UPI001EDA7006|nr:SDR family oxidoreductase [Sandaracinobacteroides sayramensis]MCG2840916.1 SDR family oxidoreductase [Sandaracinobacteroides sayramensis]